MSGGSIQLRLCRLDSRKFSSGEGNNIKICNAKSMNHDVSFCHDNKRKMLKQLRFYSTETISSSTSVGCRDFLDKLKSQLQKDNTGWFEKLIEKQHCMPLRSAFETLALQDRQILNQIEINPNLQHFLAYLTTDINEVGGSSGEKVQRRTKFSPKSLRESKSVESAFVLILHTILKIQDPRYSNQIIDECLKDNTEDSKLEASELFISKELIEDNVFSKEILEKMIKDKDFQIAVQILKIRLNKQKGWKSNNECRDDNIIRWINSLVEPSISKCLIQLTKSKSIPEIIVYDLLLRKPANELEYKYFLEFYKNYSTELNLIDQEKLFHLKQFDLRFNRNIVIPPLFGNLFHVALRSNLEHLPVLIDLFLNENEISSSHTLEQIGEMIWYLSFDHTGEHLTKPSRYHNISQSKLIKAINYMTENNKALDIDVTSMLGVSNLSFYKDFGKSFQMFKNAKKQFDHWKLEKFQPKDFKKILVSTKTKGSNQSPKINTELLNNIKIDYNIKFLCNSILLLSVTKSNEAMICQDLSNILKKVEPEVLIKYPEIWKFVLIKLNYHKMLNEQMISMIFQEYMKVHRNHGMNNYFVLDTIINNTNKVSTLTSLIENLDTDSFDDNNKSHLISKLYKFARNSIDSGDDYECLEMARRLYNESQFKSTRLNSSYLLGESIFSPLDTFERYNSINKYFKITQISISSLFVAVSKLYENGNYNSVKWGDFNEPLDFAIEEFNRNISRSYGDTTEGLLYPNDSLLILYIRVLKSFNKTQEIKGLLDRLIDLKYPVGTSLFRVYLASLNDWDQRELVKCLNAYDTRFKKLISCQNEYDLKKMREALPEIRAKGTFEDFVSRLEFNWGVVRRWNWPGREEQNV